MAYIGRQLARGENKLFDDISSSFNGSTTTFNLTVSSVATATATPYQLFVSLGGVMQKPNTDFTTAGNQITFTTAPAAGLSCWIMMQGDTIDQAAIPDAIVTPSKIANSGDFAFPADVRLKDGDGSHYVGFQAPTTVSTNKVWTLPAADGSNGQFLKTNGSAVLAWDTVDTSTLMPLAGGTFSGDVTFAGASLKNLLWDNSDGALEFNDNAKATFGNGGDLQIYHDGSNSYIDDADTGNLVIRSNQINFDKYTGEALARFRADGSCELFYDNASKLATTSAGIAITGAATISTNLTVTGDLTVSGTTTTINTQTLDVEDKNVVIGKVSSPSDTTADGGGWTLKGASDKTFNWVNATDAWTSSEHIHLGDNTKLLLGTSSECTLFHDNAGQTYLTTSTGNFHIQCPAGENSLKAIHNGSVELYHDNSKKLETTSGGINVTGAINVNGSALSTAPQITATADGAITAGDAVIIKPDGDVKKGGLDVTVQSPPTTNFSSKSALDAGGADILRSASFFITSTNKIITTYERGATDCSMHIGEVSDSGSFTFSGYNDIDSDELHGTMGFAYDTNASKGVALYYVTSNKIYARVINFSGNTLSAQSRVEVASTSSGNYKCQRLVFDSVNNKVIAAYTTSGGGVRARVGTVSGNSTSWGTEVNVTNYNTTKIALQYDDATERVIVLAEKQSNGQLDAYVGTVSGTNISFGSAQTAMGGGYGVANSDMGYDSTNNKVVVVYTAGGSAYAKVGTITGGGTNTISWGSQSSAWDTGSPTNLDIGFDPISSRIVVQSWRSGVRIASGAISGTTISFTAVSLAASGWYGGEEKSMCVAQNGQAISIGRDTSPQGPHATVTNIATAATNITAENYIGIAATSVSDNATATIDVSGATNSNQSSLTAGQKYFVQNNGSLGLTAATPKVFAGTAVSATKIIVNDQAPPVESAVDIIASWEFGSDYGQNYFNKTGLTTGTYGKFVLEIHQMQFVGNASKKVALRIYNGAGSLRTSSSYKYSTQKRTFVSNSTTNENSNGNDKWLWLGSSNNDRDFFSGTITWHNRPASSAGTASPVMRGEFYQDAWYSFNEIMKYDESGYNDDYISGFYIYNYTDSTNLANGKATLYGYKY